MQSKQQHNTFHETLRKSTTDEAAANFAANKGLLLSKQLPKGKLATKKDAVGGKKAATNRQPAVEVAAATAAA